MAKVSRKAMIAKLGEAAAALVESGQLSQQELLQAVQRLEAMDDAQLRALHREMAKAPKAPRKGKAAPATAPIAQVEAPIDMLAAQQMMGEAGAGGEPPPMDPFGGEVGLFGQPAPEGSYPRNAMFDEQPQVEPLPRRDVKGQMVMGEEAYGQGRKEKAAWDAGRQARRGEAKARNRAKWGGGRMATPMGKGLGLLGAAAGLAGTGMVLGQLMGGGEEQPFEMPPSNVGAGMGMEDELRLRRIEEMLSQMGGAGGMTAPQEVDELVRGYEQQVAQASVPMRKGLRQLYAEQGLY